MSVSVNSDTPTLGVRRAGRICRTPYPRPIRGLTRSGDVTSLSARHGQTENGNTQLADGLRADSGSHLQRTLGPQHQRASDSRGPAWPDSHIQSSPDRTQTWVVGMRKVSSESLLDPNNQVFSSAPVVRAMARLFAPASQVYEFVANVISALRFDGFRGRRW